MMIPFGPYEPDQPDSVAGITRNAIGVVPIADKNLGVAYGPFPQLVTPATATALTDNPRGSISLIDSSGNAHVYVGQTTSIVEMAADFTFTNIHTGLTLATDDDWSFAHFGSYLIYTNTAGGMFAYNVDTGSGAAAISGAPAARQVFSSNEVLIALDCDGDNRKWQNCARGNHTNWTTLESNYDTLDNGGRLIKGVDLNHGRALMLQEDGIQVVTFGGGALFGIDKLGAEIGSVGERSVVVVNGFCYGLHTRGFFRTNGVDALDWIGDNKVDRTFLNSVDNALLSGATASVDPENKLIVWYCGGTFWIYSWTLNAWSTLSGTTTGLLQFQSPGYTIDNIDSFGTLETITQSFDSKFWQGGARSLGVFGADKKVAFFTGQSMAATIDTAEYNSGSSDMITSATPVTDDAGSTLALGVMDTIGAIPTFGPDISRSASGRVPVRGRGKNIVYRHKSEAGHSGSFARGVNHSEGASGGPR